MSGLPEREYFNIIQLTERWQKMYGECSQYEVLHYIETGKLEPSFRFKSVECRQYVSDGKHGWREAEPLISNGNIVPFHCSGLLLMCGSKRYWKRHYPITPEWRGDIGGEMFRAPDDSAQYFKSFQVVPLKTLEVSLADLLFTLAEVLRFESEHPPTQNAAAPTIEATPPQATPPPRELIYPLVTRASWELQKESGKFPQYTEVLNKLQHMAKIDDQAGAIIEHVDDDNGISVIGRERPFAISTLKNWLTDIRKSLSDAK